MESGDLIFEYTEGGRKGSNLVYVKSDRQLYRFKYNYKDEKRYICYQKNCSGSVAVIGERCKIVNNRHNHEGQEAVYRSLKTVSRLKEICKKLDKSPRQVYDEEMEKSQDIPLVPYTKVRRTLERIRAARFPKLPQSAKDILETFGNGPLILNPDKRHSVDRFYQSTIIEKDYAFTVFTKSIKSKEQSPGIAEHFTVDGTFSIAPISGYKHLLIMSITCNEYVFPFAYALMSVKTEEAYKRIFEHIKQHSLKLQPMILYADYEEALCNALQAVFLLASIQPSWYHYAQAMRRDMGEFDTLNKDQKDTIQQFCSKFVALALLKPEDISKAFRILQSESGEEFTINGQNIFAPFISHFEQNWIMGEMASNFSFYKEDTTISNILTEFHNRFVERLPKNGNYYKFLNTIIDFNFDVTPSLKNKIKTQGDSINTLLSGLEEKLISLPEFLRHVAKELCDIQTASVAAQEVEFSDNELDIKQEPNAEERFDSDGDSFIVPETSEEPHEQMNIECEESKETYEDYNEPTLRRRRDRQVLYDWTDCEIHQLIEAVHQRPELWRANHEWYKVRVRKEDAWRTIETVFRGRLKTSELIAKWNNLRVQYRSYITKNKTKSSIRWKFFDAMQFIGESNDDSASTTTTAGAASETPRTFNFSLIADYESTSSNHSSIYLPPVTPTTVTPAESSCLLPRKFKRSIVQLDTTKDEDHVVEEKKTAVNDSKSNDELDIFGQFVVSEIRRLSNDLHRQQLKRCIQRAIMDFNEKIEEKQRNPFKKFRE